MSVKAIPDGYYSLTPYLVCKGAAKAIDFYAKAFGAQETVRMPGPHGSIMHAEVKIGNAMLMLSDENKERGQLSPESIGGSACSITAAGVFRPWFLHSGCYPGRFHMQRLWEGLLRGTSVILLSGPMPENHHYSERALAA